MKEIAVYLVLEGLRHECRQALYCRLLSLSSNLSRFNLLHLFTFLISDLYRFE